MAGFKSPAFWLGLSGGSQPAQQAGFRTPLPNWNAGGSQPAQQAGFRGLLGFWVGGTAAGEEIAPTTMVGGPSDRTWRRRREEEEELMILIHAWLH